MAVVAWSLRYDHSLLSIASRENVKQLKFYLPAKQEAKKPGMLIFGNVDDAGVLGTGATLWADSLGKIRLAAGEPGEPESDGVIIGDVTGYVTTTLNNLGTTAINASLLFDTTNSYDVGSASVGAKNIYADTAVLSDVISEFSSAAGVTIDGVKLKDSEPYCDVINEKTVTAGVTIDGVKLKDSQPYCDVINEKTGATGVTIDSVILKDGGATLSGTLTTTQPIVIAADNINLALGASGATDSALYFDGSNLVLFDWANRIAYPAGITLSQLLGTSLNSPTISGDVTISDGKLIWTDAVAENAGVFTFAGTSHTDIAIASSITTGKSLSIVADACTSGSLAYLESSAAGFVGNFIKAYDGANTVFTLGLDGAQVIRGLASTDMITVTTGDIQLTAGDIDVDLGILTVDWTGDEGSYFKKNHATSTSAVLEIEQTHTGATGSALLLDQKATGNAYGLEITHAGDLAAIGISASAARTGDVVGITMANQLAQKAVNITGAWTGANGVGLIDLNSSGIMAAGASMVRVASTGANTAASYLVDIEHSTGAFTNSTNGMCIRSVDTAAVAGTSYNTYIASTANRGLYVAPNALIYCADNLGLDALTVTQLDATQDKDGIVVAVTGDGYVLKGTVNTVTGKGLGMICANGQTTPLVVLDGSTGANGFVGADGIGLVDITSDGALAHVGSTLIDAAFSGTAQAASTGFMVNLRDTAAASAGSYLVQAISTNNNLLNLTCTDATKNAINVVTGISDFNGRANLGGLIFLDQTAETLTGAGAVNITALKTLLVTTAADALTLANGAEGQIKIIKMKTDGGDGTLTPTTPHGFATITFNDVGDSCILMWMDAGWIILGQNGCTVA